MRKLLLLLCVAALVATAAAHKRQPKQGDACHIRRYACVSSKAFCNGGTVMACPAGTTCVTQYGKNALKVSPCVTRSARHRSLLGGWHKPQHKPQPKSTHTAPRCHADNYVCLSPSGHAKTSTRFCLGGYSMACPAGTVCRTQPRHKRQSVSPCGWP